MKGDFARFTFDPTLHYSQVLQQQGRVLLEADWNEQGRIQLHLLRTLIRDLVGPCWAIGNGFTISTSSPPNADGTSKSLQPPDWLLKAGHFYVDGILCINEADCTLATQPNAPTFDYGTGDGSSGFETQLTNFALWLDVWERHLCALEAPAIADVALEGVDTASRAQVVWQLRMLDQAHADQRLKDVNSALNLRMSATADGAAKATIQKQIDSVTALQGSIDGTANSNGTGNTNDSPCTLVRQVLAARASYALPGLSAVLGQAPSDSDPCVIAADARYRGCENQLYRVEIHQGGLAGTAAAPGTASFKWSRENGSVVFPVASVAPPTAQPDGSAQLVVTLARLGRDARLGLAANDWVELVDDDYTLGQRAYPLLKVIGPVDVANSTVTLAVPKGITAWPLSNAPAKHPLLRRWDHGEDANAPGLVAVVEGTTITLEDNIQIIFAPGGLYATGDYWLIPARVAGSGMLYWPTDTSGNPASLPPRGLHHYAVLGVNGDGGLQTCCCRFDSLCAVIQTLQQQQPGTAPSNAVLAPSAAAKVAGNTNSATKKKSAVNKPKTG